MNTFAKIYQCSLERKGDEEQLYTLLPAGLKTAAELSAIPDNYYLAEMMRPTFKAGVINGLALRQRFGMSELWD
ncbi:MAG: hypothetical protein COA83_06880 [Methylophaga sp.]|nr:MAG: hypothetical protein COA83_06880 [Methylophaga sp.]